MAKKETTVEEAVAQMETEYQEIVEESNKDNLAKEAEHFKQFEQETSTSLVPVVDQDIDIYVKQQNFQAGRSRRIMQTSYTGAEKISIDDLDQRNGVRYMHVQGCFIQAVPDQINKETGEIQTRAFKQVLFKLTDGRVVSAGGKMAEAFAEGLIEDLGAYDWPEPLHIVARQHKGKNFTYPNFQVME